MYRFSITLYPYDGGEIHQLLSTTQEMMLTSEQVDGILSSIEDILPYEFNYVIGVRDWNDTRDMWNRYEGDLNQYIIGTPKVPYLETSGLSWQDYVEKYRFDDISKNYTFLCKATPTRFILYQCNTLEFIQGFITGLTWLHQNWHQYIFNLHETRRPYQKLELI